MSNNQVDYQKILQNIKKPNIAVIGKTGVGKSTLINTVFKINTAEAGAGRAVTKNYKKYSIEDSPVVIYDSPGYECGKDEKTLLDGTIKFLNEHRMRGVEEQIHLIWYAINSSSARFENFDETILRKIEQETIPAIIVLTQCDRASDEEKSAIKTEIVKSRFLKVYDVIEVAASPLYRNNTPLCQPFGLDLLIKQTSYHLPKIYVEAVAVAQMADIELKRETAWSYIYNSAMMCFGVGAAPIPFTSPVATVGALSYLFNQITILYGFHSKRIITLAITTVTAGGLLMIVGSTVIDSFSILAPGTSLIAGALAALYTTLAGLAYASTCEEMHKRKIKGEIEKKLRSIFKEKFEEFMQKINISTPDDLISIGERWINKEI